MYELIALIIGFVCIVALIAIINKFVDLSSDPLAEKVANKHVTSKVKVYAGSGEPLRTIYEVDGDTIQIPIGDLKRISIVSPCSELSLHWCSSIMKEFYKTPLPNMVRKEGDVKYIHIPIDIQHTPEELYKVLHRKYEKIFLSIYTPKQKLLKSITLIVYYTEKDYRLHTAAFDRI